MCVTCAARGALGAGLPQRQQRDDIVARQWWIGAIGQREFAGRSVKVQRNLILLNRRAGFHVNHRVEAERIRKVDIAARNFVPVSVEQQISGEHVDVAQHDGMLPGAAHAQVRLRFQLRARPLHAGIRSGHRLNFELKIAQER